MKYKKRACKEKYDSRLWQIWREMIRRARQRCGTDGDIAVDPTFQDWGKFAAWAKFNGYADGMELCKRDSALSDSPENCFWSGQGRPVADVPVVVESAGRSRDVETPGRAESPWGGIRRQRLYNIWRGMKRRCESVTCKDYPDYGGRGIRVCGEWQDFLAFYEWAWNHGYAPTYSIDRIDVNGDYRPENCRWATEAEQAVNVRIYGGRYTTLRMRAGEAVRYLSGLGADSVVTVILRTDVMEGEVPEQTDYGPVPPEYRRDRIVGRGRNGDEAV